MNDIGLRRYGSRARRQLTCQLYAAVSDNYHNELPSCVIAARATPQDAKYVAVRAKNKT